MLHKFTFIECTVKNLFDLKYIKVITEIANNVKYLHILLMYFKIIWYQGKKYQF